MFWKEKLSTGGSFGDVESSMGWCFFFMVGLADGPRTRTGLELGVVGDFLDEEVWAASSGFTRRVAS